MDCSKCAWPNPETCKVCKQDQTSREVTVTMPSGDWQVVQEFFINWLYEDDWTNDNTLKDEQLERIRQKLIEATGRR